LSLRELAERADVSPSFLSQLENGRSSASIATLARIAGALEVTIADLFDSGSIGPAPLRADERPVLRADDNVRKTLLTRSHLDGMGVYGAIFGPGGSTGAEQYSHPDNHEVVVVIRGELVVELNQARHVLGVGDSIDFDSTVPHRLVNDSDQDAEAHWVVGPAQPSAPRRNRRKK
jgi:quercetin dioxygenase-like cupin family protein/DNA-binding XRE family transcriptional regulator